MGVGIRDEGGDEGGEEVHSVVELLRNVNHLCTRGKRVRGMVMMWYGNDNVGSEAVSRCENG